MRIPPGLFVDGGVLMNTPLSPAIHSGARVLHVIYLDPDIKCLPLSDLQTTLGTLQRIMTIARAASLEPATSRRPAESIAAWP